MENNGKMRTSAEPNKIYIVHESYPKMYLLLNLNQNDGHLCQVGKDRFFGFPGGFHSLFGKKLLLLCKDNKIWHTLVHP